GRHRPPGRHRRLRACRLHRGHLCGPGRDEPHRHRRCPRCRRRADDHDGPRELPGFRRGDPGAPAVAGRAGTAGALPRPVPPRRRRGPADRGPVKTVTLDDGTVYRAKTLIISTGSAYRKLGIDGESRLSGKGVSWCATCDGFFFKDQDIVVVGGGDSAVEEATFLTRFGQNGTMVHRRDELRASKIMARRAEADPKLQFQWNSEVVSINGIDKVESVTLRDTLTGEERDLPTSAVFEAIGHIPRTELLEGKLELDEQGYIVVQGRSTYTSVAGVFAAGDVVDHTYRQAVTAAG